MSKRVAIVIGIGFYKHNKPLEYCPPSAEDVYNLLISPDFGACDPERSILKVVRDKDEILADTDLLSLVNKKIESLKADEQLVFFFSGHAAINKNDELFLLLPDSKEDGVEWVKSYDLVAMSRKMKSRGVSKALLIIDACHSEAMFNSMKDLQGESENWRPHTLPSGIGFMASSGRFQYARQSDELKRTLFSYYFCEGLKNWPDAQSEYITLLELKNYINGKIQLNHPPTNQDVHISIREGKDDLWISKNISYAKRKTFLATLEFPKSFPFTNRTTEIQSVLLPYSHPYRIIDAPAGYGKTVFFKEIQRRLQSEPVVCARIEVDSQLDESIAIKTFISNLILSINDKASLDGESVDQLTVLLIKEIENKISSDDDQAKKGFMLLVDLQGKPCEVVLKHLVEELIPDIVQSLFFNYESRFQFVIAGRYITQIVDSFESRQIPFEPQSLEPFGYEVVRNSVNNYFNQQKGRNVSQALIQTIAAHLMFFSGGHPGCIAKLLTEYGDAISYTPYRFFRGEGKELSQKIVAAIAEEIRSSLDKDLQGVLDKFSIFRYADFQVIKKLFTLQNEREMYTLSDRLTKTYLLSWKGRLLHDDMIRRLLSIRLRQKDYSQFSSLCKQAQQICLEQVKDKDIQWPEKWVIEYLFQLLQEEVSKKEVPQAQERTTRMEFKQKVFKHDVPAVLEDYIGHRKMWEREQRALEQVLQNDKEFRFTVNYCLRNDEYGEEPYKELQKEIKDFFSLKYDNAGGLK